MQNEVTLVRRGRKPKAERSSRIPFFAGPGKRQCLRRFNFLVDLLNADIINLSLRDFLYIFSEFLIVFYENHVEYDEEAVRNLCQDTDQDRQQLKYVQEILRRKIENFESEEDQIEISKPTVEVGVLDDPKTIRYLLVDGRIVLKPYLRMYIYEKLDALQKESVQRFPTWNRFDPDEYDVPDPPPNLIPGMFSKFLDERLFETVNFFLYSVFERIPLFSINQCPECLKYFKSTRRKQSPLCTSCLRKNTTYEWRKSNRETYNEYQRNLQKGVKTSIREIRARREREKKLKEG